MTVSSHIRCVRPEILEANALFHLQVESDHLRDSPQETLEQRHRQGAQSRLPLQLLRGRSQRRRLRRWGQVHQRLSQRRLLQRGQRHRGRRVHLLRKWRRRQGFRVRWNQDGFQMECQKMRKFHGAKRGRRRSLMLARKSMIRRVVDTSPLDVWHRE